MTKKLDGRANNGGKREGAGRKMLGADKMCQFTILLKPDQAAWFKVNRINALREVIQMVIEKEKRLKNNCLF